MVGKVKFMLTETQIGKIGTAFKRQDGVTLKLNTSLISPSGVPIVLTEHEKQMLKDGLNHNIHISYSRLKEMGSSWIRTGGKIGGILPLIPIIIGALTAASLAGGTAAGIANTVKTAKEISNEKRKTDAQIENEKRKTDAFVAASQAKDAVAAAQQVVAQTDRGFHLYPGKGLHLTGRGLSLHPGKGLHLTAGKGLYL